MIKEDRDSKVNAFAGNHEIGKLRRRKVKEGQGPKVKGAVKLLGRSSLAAEGRTPHIFQVLPGTAT